MASEANHELELAAPPQVPINKATESSKCNISLPEKDSEKHDLEQSQNMKCESLQISDDENLDQILKLVRNMRWCFLVTFLIILTLGIGVWRESQLQYHKYNLLWLIIYEALPLFHILKGLCLRTQSACRCLLTTFKYLVKGGLILIMVVSFSNTRLRTLITLLLAAYYVANFVVDWFSKSAVLVLQNYQRIYKFSRVLLTIQLSVVFPGDSGLLRLQMAHFIPLYICIGIIWVFGGLTLLSSKPGKQVSPTAHNVAQDPNIALRTGRSHARGSAGSDKSDVRSFGSKLDQTNQSMINRITPENETAVLNEYQSSFPGAALCFWLGFMLIAGVLAVVTSVLWLNNDLNQSSWKPLSTILGIDLLVTAAIGATAWKLTPDIISLLRIRIASRQSPLPATYGQNRDFEQDSMNHSSAKPGDKVAGACLPRERRAILTSPKVNKVSKKVFPPTLPPWYLSPRTPPSLANSKASLVNSKRTESAETNQELLRQQTGDERAGRGQKAGAPPRSRLLVEFECFVPQDEGINDVIVIQGNDIQHQLDTVESGYFVPKAGRILEDMLCGVCHRAIPLAMTVPCGHGGFCSNCASLEQTIGKLEDAQTTEEASFVVNDALNSTQPKSRFGHELEAIIPSVAMSSQYVPCLRTGVKCRYCDQEISNILLLERCPPLAKEEMAETRNRVDSEEEEDVLYQLTTIIDINHDQLGRLPPLISPFQAMIKPRIESSMIAGLTDEPQSEKESQEVPALTLAVKPRFRDMTIALTDSRGFLPRDEASQEYSNVAEHSLFEIHEQEFEDDGPTSQNSSRRKQSPRFEPKVLSASSISKDRQDHQVED